MTIKLNEVVPPLTKSVKQKAFKRHRPPGLNISVCQDGPPAPPSSVLKESLEEQARYREKQAKYELDREVKRINELLDHGLQPLKKGTVKDIEEAIRRRFMEV